MYNKILIAIAIVTGVAVLGLQPFVVNANSYPYFGPQSLSDDYLQWGNDQYPKNERHGITFNLDITSTSFQSILGSITLEYVPGSNLINQREITQFLVVGNGRIIDMFEPSWDTETDNWRTFYPLRIAMEDWNIGSSVALQVVAITHQEQSPINADFDNAYVVAWSDKKAEIQLKPLPVIDRDAITVLEAILAKLEQMRSDITGKIDQMRVELSGKLSQIDKSVKDIYEVPPATQARFDAALANLQAKLPTEQLKQQSEQMANIIKNSEDRINRTPQPLKFGEINWFGLVTTPIVDFTDFEEQIKMLRKILQVALWCEFFYFVVLILRPKLTV